MTHLSPISTVQLSPTNLSIYISEYMGRHCMLQCVRVCCIPCTFITPIAARDPLFGLLHNRRRRRLRATHTHTHIMQVKMEPNQRGYAQHTHNRVFCVSLTRHRPLWRSSQSARARRLPPKKKGWKK